MFRVTYHRAPWSEEFEDFEPGDFDEESQTIECGKWASIEDFIEGALPGEYWFDEEVDVGNGQAFVILVGAPESREEPFLTWLKGLPSGPLIDLMMSTHIGDVGKVLISAYERQTSPDKRAAASE